MLALRVVKEPKLATSKGASRSRLQNCSGRRLAPAGQDENQAIVTGDQLEVSELCGEDDCDIYRRILRRCCSSQRRRSQKWSQFGIEEKVH